MAAARSAPLHPGRWRGVSLVAGSRGRRGAGTAACMRAFPLCVRAPHFCPAALLPCARAWFVAPPPNAAAAGAAHTTHITRACGMLRLLCCTRITHTANEAGSARAACRCLSDAAAPHARSSCSGARLHASSKDAALPLLLQRHFSDGRVATWQRGRVGLHCGGVQD